MSLPAEITPDRWIVQVFSAKAVAEAAIVRRRIKDVERLIGRERFLHEVRRRGFRVVENAGQFVIFCNNEPVQILI